MNNQGTFKVIVYMHLEMWHRPHGKVEGKGAGHQSAEMDTFLIVLPLILLCICHMYLIHVFITCIPYIYLHVSHIMIDGSVLISLKDIKCSVFNVGYWRALQPKSINVFPSQNINQK